MLKRKKGVTIESTLETLKVALVPVYDIYSMQTFALLNTTAVLGTGR